jgi:hypothetical protein
MTLPDRLPIAGKRRYVRNAFAHLQIGCLFWQVCCFNSFLLPRRTSAAFTARFEKYMNIPADKRSWARPVCQFELATRGAVWLIIGWFLIKSAWMAKGGEVEGMAEALQWLRGSPYGSWLLGIVAAGLFAFGIYSLLEAAYRRIDTSSLVRG